MPREKENFGFELFPGSLSLKNLLKSGWVREKEILNFGLMSYVPEKSYTK
jgi:hypothetical protein